jgi:hypothetical protein
MRQTAVEWLFEQLWETPKDKFTWQSILKEAKEYEKIQIEDAFGTGFLIDSNRWEFHKIFNQYLKENYK